MDSRQDEPDDEMEVIADGLELMCAFRRIASPKARREIIELAVALAKEK